MRLDIYLHYDDALETLERNIMSKIDDAMAAVAEEKEQVKAKLDDLKAQIQALKDQVAAGVATPEQLDALIDAVHNIFTPDPVVDPAPAEEPQA